MVPPKPVFKPGHDIGETVPSKANPHVLVITAQHISRLYEDAFLIRQGF